MSDAHAIYGVERWGRGLFKVTPEGHIGLMNPENPDAVPVSLPRVLADLEARGVATPVVVRVNSFLAQQVRRLNECFADAIRDNEYQGVYRGVFPIKVNQQAEVVDRIVEFGRPYGFGLEAGSKPELIVALSRRLGTDSLIICNGIKDAEFVRLAISARKLGVKPVIVLESPRELETVLAEAERLGEEPLLGVRVKLTRRVGGAWAASSGDRSAFGLNTAQIIDVVDRLRERGMLHCLMLQHSHLGSQIPNVIDVRYAVDEACRFFIELRREGAPLTHLDLGGGLGVDYTGEARDAPNSVNYSLAEYCANVVETARYAMDEAGEPHPTLVTESGRATTAYSSMLLFDILEATEYHSAGEEQPEADDHHMIRDLAGVVEYLSEARLQETINDARYYRDELRALFRRGYIDLRQMARAERIFLRVMGAIRRVAEGAEHLPESVAEALEEQVDIYHGNFSLFQSLPDAWAIDQIHPVAPLQRLNEPPTRRAVISDITCDSDGKLDRFVLASGVSRSLPVHPLGDEPYYIGVFFVGAYQETLGDLHNLFGDTNVATIELRPDGGFDLLREVEGDSIGEVMSYVEYDPRACMDAFKAIVEEAVSRGAINVRQRRALIETYRDSINGYTYYEQ